jgi:hypothetical protein
MKINYTPWDKDRLADLLNGGSLTARVIATEFRPELREALPIFEGLLHWTLEHPQSIEWGSSHDITFVLWKAGMEAMVRRLKEARETVVLVIPHYESIAEEEWLHVIAEAELSPSMALPSLAHAIFAPVLSDGIVCVDWSDVLTALDHGEAARLISVSVKSDESPVEWAARLTLRIKAGVPTMPRLNAMLLAIFATSSVPMSHVTTILSAVRRIPEVGDMGLVAACPLLEPCAETQISVLLISGTKDRIARPWSPPMRPLPAPDDMPAFLRS